MFDKIITEKSGILRGTPDSYKNKKICDNPIDNCSHALEFVYDCYKTQKMCNKVCNKICS